MSVNAPETRRRARRLKIFAPALLMRGLDTYRVHLLDVSRGGALAHADTPPRKHDRVRIQCETLYANATVAWVAGKRFGLMFTVPLDERMLRAIIGAELPPTASPAAHVERPRVPVLPTV